MFNLNDKCMFSFIKNFQTIFQSGLPFAFKRGRVPVALHLPLHLYREVLARFLV